METSDLTDNPGYYRDNLLALFEALELLDAGPDTGDWYREVIDWLICLGAKSSGANVSPEEMAIMIYKAATAKPLTEVMALIGKDKT